MNILDQWDVVNEALGLGKISEFIERKPLNNKKTCEKCNGTGEVEVYGGGENFDWDVVGIKKCDCKN
jgi:hypothetical protein